MKTKILIVAFLLVSLICAFAFTSHAQAYKSTGPLLSSIGDTINTIPIVANERNIAKVVPSQRTLYRNGQLRTKSITYLSNKEIKDSTNLIGDETWLTMTKTGAKVLSYSESAFKAISLKFGESFKSIMIKYKTDRNGPYREYVIYMDQSVANNIKQWAKNNL